MNKVDVIYLVFFQFIIYINIVKCANVLENNLFRDINEQLQDTINKVFKKLKLDKNFTQKETNKNLLDMQANIKAAAEKHYRNYKLIKKTAKLSPDVPQPTLFELRKPLNYAKKFLINSSRDTVKERALNLDMSSLEIPNNSTEIIKILKQHLKMNFTNNTSSHTNDTMYSVEDLRPFRFVRRRNFNAWRASNSSEMNARRIFHGKTGRIRRYPFVTSIHLLGEFVCTGSIISRNMVLTAASCVQVAHNNPDYVKHNPWDIALRVGSDYTDRSGDWIYVDNVTFHPEFDPDSIQNNLALIHTKITLNLKKKNKKIRRIEYEHTPDRNRPPDEIKEVILIGFGDKDIETSEEIAQLTYTRLDMYNIDDCKETYSRKYVTEKNFCAGFIKKSSGACQRDVGGPAIVNSLLLGVVSFGPPICGTPDAPTVFTNLRHYIDWINTVVKQNSLPQTPSTPSFYLKDLVETTTMDPMWGKPEDYQRMSQMQLELFGNKGLLPMPPGYINPITLRLPKAIKILSSFLRQLMTPDLYSDDNFSDTKSDTHLWSTTTMDPHHNPLLNESIFFIDDILVDETTTTTSFAITNNTRKRRHRKRNGTTESLAEMMKTIREYNLPELPLRNVEKHKNHLYIEEYDYDSVYDKGMSIELSPKQQVYPANTVLSPIKMGATTPTLPPITPPRKTKYSFSSIPKIAGLNTNLYEAEAEKFLQKNFKLDESLKMNPASEEFILYLMKQSTPKEIPFLNRFTGETKALKYYPENIAKSYPTKFISSEHKNYDENTNKHTHKEILNNNSIATETTTIAPSEDTSAQIVSDRFFSTVGLNSESNEKVNEKSDEHLGYTEESGIYRAISKNWSTMYMNLNLPHTNISIKGKKNKPRVSKAFSSFSEKESQDFDKESKEAFKVSKTDDFDPYINKQVSKLYELMDIRPRLGDDSRLRTIVSSAEDMHVLARALRNLSNLVQNEFFDKKTHKLDRNRYNLTGFRADHEMSFVEYIDTK